MNEDHKNRTQRFYSTTPPRDPVALPIVNMAAHQAAKRRILEGWAEEESFKDAQAYRLEELPPEAPLPRRMIVKPGEPEV